LRPECRTGARRAAKRNRAGSKPLNPEKRAREHPWPTYGLALLHLIGTPKLAKRSRRRVRSRPRACPSALMGRTSTDGAIAVVMMMADAEPRSLPVGRGEPLFARRGSSRKRAGTASRSVVSLRSAQGNRQSRDRSKCPRQPIILVKLCRPECFGFACRRNLNDKTTSPRNRIAIATILFAKIRLT